MMKTANRMAMLPAPARTNHDVLRRRMDGIGEALMHLDYQ